MATASATETVGIDLMVNNQQASQALAQTNQRLTELGQVSAKVEQQSKGLKNALNGTGDKAKKLGDASGKAATKGERMSGAFNSVRRRMLAAAASIAVFVTATFGLGAAVRTAKQFEETMSKVAAISGVSKLSEDFKNLEKEARRLGAVTTFSASQAAEGLQFLSMAGFTTEQSMQALEGTLRLAQAGALDLGTAADIATNVLAGFGLQAGQIGRVADVLAQAASSSNTNVSELGQAFKFVAPAAGALNVSIEETSAMLGALANRGLKAGIAGRNLQTSMIKMVAPTDQAKEALGRLGLSMADIDPTIVGIRASLGKLQGASVKDVSDLFGVENIKTMLTLIRSLNSSDGFDGLITKMEEAKGRASEMSKEMTDNLAGSMKIAKSAIEEMFLVIVKDSGLQKNLKGAADAVAQFLTNLQNSGKAAGIVAVIGDAFNGIGTGIKITAKVLGFVIGPLMKIKTLLLALGVMWVAMKVKSVLAATQMGAAVSLAMRRIDVSTRRAGGGFAGLAATAKAAGVSMAAAMKAAAASIRMSMLLAFGAVTIALEIMMSMVSKKMKETAAQVERMKNSIDFGFDVDKLVTGSLGVETREELDAIVASIDAMIDAKKRANLHAGTAEESKQIRNQLNILEQRRAYIIESGEEALKWAEKSAKAKQKEIDQIDAEVAALKEREKLVAGAREIISGRLGDVEESSLSEMEDEVEIGARLKLLGLSSPDDLTREFEEIRDRVWKRGGEGILPGDKERLEKIIEAMAVIEGLQDSIADKKEKAAEQESSTRSAAEAQMSLLSAQLSGDQARINAVKDRLRLEELIAKFRKAGMDDAEAVAKKMLALEQQKRAQDEGGGGGVKGGVVADSLTAIGGGGGMFAFGGGDGKRVMQDRVRNIDSNLGKLLTQGFKLVDPLGAEIKVRIR